MAEQAELKAAAGALLTYHLGGRRTDDALLGQIQAAWVEYEALRQEQQERVLLQSGVAGKRCGGVQSPGVGGTRSPAAGGDGPPPCRLAFLV